MAIKNPRTDQKLNDENPLRWTHPLNRSLYFKSTPFYGSSFYGGPTLRDMTFNKRVRNDVTLNGATWVPPRYSSIRGSLLFVAASSQYATFAKSFSQTAYTLIVRFRLNSTPGAETMNLISADDAGGSNRVFQFRVNTSSKLEGIFFDSIFNPGFVTGTTTLTTGVDYVAHFTVDSSNQTIYLNGKQEATHGASSLSAASMTMYLGRVGSATPSNFLDGEISSVTVHTVALSAGEVAESYLEEISSNRQVFNFLHQQIAEPRVPTAKWMACASATYGTDPFDVVSGTITADSTVTRRGTRSWKLDTTGTATSAAIARSGVCSDSGGCISGRVNFPSVTPAVTVPVLVIANSGGTAVWQLRLKTNSTLDVNPVGGTPVSGTTVIKANKWYRFSMSWVATSTTVFEIRIFIDGVLEATAKNSGTLTGVGASIARFVSNGTAGANWVQYMDEMYVDDRIDLSDTGNIGVTAKLPNANNTNNFNTAVGAAPANRWTNVNERPDSTTNGWEETTVTATQENYGIESAKQGDYDITNFNLVARMAWISSKRGTPAATLSAHANNTGAAVGTTMTLGPIAVTAGQLMVVAFADRVGGGTPTIADNLDGNAWTTLGPTTSTVRLTSYYKVATTTGNLTATLTFTSSSAKRAGAIGSFTFTSGYVIDTHPADNTDATTPFDCPSSGVLAQASEIVFGSRANATTGTLAATAPNLIVDTAATTGGSSTGVGLCYQVVNATTAVAPQMTGTSAAGVDATFSFKLGTGIGDPKIMNNGTETSVVLTTSNVFYYNIVNDTNYPSNAAVVGMRASGDDADTFLYECGVMIAYIEAPSLVMAWRRTTRFFRRFFRCLSDEYMPLLTMGRSQTPEATRTSSADNPQMTSLSHFEESCSPKVQKLGILKKRISESIFKNFRRRSQSGQEEVPSRQSAHPPIRVVQCGEQLFGAMTPQLRRRVEQRRSSLKWRGTKEAPHLTCGSLTNDSVLQSDRQAD